MKIMKSFKRKAREAREKRKKEKEEIVHPTTCDCCDTDEDALKLLFKEDEE